MALIPIRYRDEQADPLTHLPLCLPVLYYDIHLNIPYVMQ